MINDVYVKELEQSLKISSTSALIFLTSIRFLFYQKF